MFRSYAGFRTVALALLVATLPAPTFAQAPSTPPDITRAQQAMQAGQIDSAITVLEAIHAP